MKLVGKFKEAVCAIAIAVAALSSCTNKQESGFAVVIDPESYNQAKAEIDQYLKVIENRGLYPILVIDQWGVPDSIRAKLIELHSAKKHPIEGCVFIGDIPVAMVRDAQHMASALKMDQDAFPRMDTHIPSDRYYDSFGLQFDYIDKDSTRWFFYSLRADCEQVLHPTIYSARITPRDNERGNKYEKLREYMKRVNAADARQNTLDHALLFNGSDNLSNSLVARMDAKWEFYDQFPWMRDRNQSMEYMDYSRDEYIKARLCDEVQDPDLDYALLIHHGDTTIQYLSNGMDLKKSRLQTFEFDHYHPQATLVSLDACYNGSFHLDNNIQEAYLFNKGNGTLLVLANSVVSIQDKWANRYVGLMGLGMRAGYMAKFDTFMEFHLFGDPTYTFAKSGDCGFDINDAILNGSDKFWQKQLDNEYPAVQSLACKMLSFSTNDNSAILLDKYRSSECGMIRLAALMDISGYRNRNSHECIREAMFDEYEMAQRFATIYAGKYGNPSIMPEIARLRVQNNLSERVEFDLDCALRSYDSTLVYNALDSAFAVNNHCSNPDSVLNFLHEHLKLYAGYLPLDIRKAIKSEKASVKSKMNAVTPMRNNPPHFVLPEILDWLETPCAGEDSILYKGTFEALGWFWMSYRHNDIAAVAKKVSEDDRYPQSVRKEALKTYNRTK